MHFHCWHKVKGSERKFKNNSRCKKEHPYIHNDYVRYTIQEKCCICGKEKVHYIEIMMYNER